MNQNCLHYEACMRVWMIMADISPKLDLHCEDCRHYVRRDYPADYYTHADLVEYSWGMYYFHNEGKNYPYIRPKTIHELLESTAKEKESEAGSKKCQQGINQSSD